MRKPRSITRANKKKGFPPEMPMSIRNDAGYYDSTPYLHLCIFRPVTPDIQHWILPDEKKIYINIAAPDGKIDRLVFKEEKTISVKIRKW